MVFCSHTTALVEHIDLTIGPQLVGFQSSADNKGFKHPTIDITPAQETAFTLELQETHGRARELIDHANE